MSIEKLQIENLDIFLSIKEKAKKYVNKSYIKITFLTIFSILLFFLSSFFYILLLNFVNSFFSMDNFFKPIISFCFLILNIYTLTLPFLFFRFLKLKKYKKLNVSKNIYKIAYFYFHSQNITSNSDKSIELFLNDLNKEEIDFLLNPELSDLVLRSNCINSYLLDKKNKDSSYIDKYNKNIIKFLEIYQPSDEYSFRDKSKLEKHFYNKLINEKIEVKNKIIKEI
jgi:ABC-type multidrug transport system fused ATPase/permease subunit